MTQFADKYLVESSRLQNWDYSTPGIYFITICTLNHNNFFGKIINDQIVLSNKGIIVKQELLKTFEIRQNLKLHDYVIMPNHLHLLMEIKYKINQLNPNNVETHHECCRDVARYVSTENKKEIDFSLISPKANSISSIVRSFKSAVTKSVNTKTCFFAWQSRFYDQIVIDKNQYLIIKKYIQNNISNWEKDKFYK